jgi:hypothetical protein
LAYIPSTFAVRNITYNKTGGICMADTLKNEDNTNNSTQFKNEYSQFYNSKNDLILPRAAECYFNWRCIRYSDTTLDTKLRELGYLLSQGFDLKLAISEYMQRQDFYVKSAIRQTYVFYIMYIRYRDYYHTYSDILIKLSENKLLQLLIDELSLVYNRLEHEVNCAFWDENTVLEYVKKLEGKESEKEKFIATITSSEMMKLKYAE